MKATKLTLILLFILSLTATSSLAIEGGNPKKGKYLFKKNCKSCHMAGGEGGEVTPLNKTQRQWDRFFKRNSADCLKHVGGKLSEQDMLDIHQFLFDYASDSEQPQTCG